jgi:uncharacterized repeat protein (TIGR03943 family)
VTPPAAAAVAVRQGQALVLLLLGGAVARVGITGASVRYVKEGMRPLLVVAGLLLIVTAAMTLRHARRPAAPDDAGHPDDTGHQHDAGHPDDDGHQHAESRAGWLLLLPVVGLILVAPPALGSFSAVQAGSVLAGPGAGGDYAPLPPGEPVTLPVLDYASRAVYDGGRTLAGRTLRLTGFVTPGADGQPELARIVLSCCAADGRPVKVALSGDVPTGVPADTWLTVVGSYAPTLAHDPVNDAAVPYLHVTSWQQTAEPAQPYE